MKTYEAIIDGDKVTWVGEALDTSHGPVTVTVELQDDLELTSGVEMAKVIEQIRSDGVRPSFGDPVAWQRETRTDRILPGRG